MNSLFETTAIGNLELKNRFVRSATCEAMADEDGGVTPKLIDTFVALAEGDVEKIIEAARLAPSGFNSQPWEAVVVKDPAVKDEVTRILQGKEDVASISRKGFAVAPVYILFFGDTRVRSWAPGPVKTDDETWTYIFQASLAAGFEHMHLAAASLDLGAMWVTAFRLNGADEKIKAHLNIPDYLDLFEMLAVGYPGQAPPEKKLRSLDSMVHYDVCGADGFRSAEELETYFGKKPV